MTGDLSVERIVEQLKHFIATDGVSATRRDQAAVYLERLETPLRIVFMGPPASGQRRIINAMLGSDLLPEASARPVQKLIFGTEARVEITRSDGSVQEYTGTPDPAAMRDAVYLQRQCDSPLLRQFSVLDLVVDGTPSEMRAAVRWAATKADMAVWCSGTFASAEQQFWRSAVPERLLDHAFLLLTQDATGTRAAAFKQALEGEFLDVLSVPVAGNAENAGHREVSAAALRPLISGLERHASDGRRADADSALIFLKKFGIHNLSTTPSVPEAPDAPAGAEIVPLTAGRDTEEQKPVTAPERAGRNQATLRSACAHIREQARDMLEVLRTEEPGRDFAARCGEVIRQLSIILDGSDDTNDPEIISLSDVLIEAEELVVLLEMEQDGTPAIDAACVLLQLRTEFESLLAA